MVIWKFNGPLTFNSCTRFARLVLTNIGDHIRDTGSHPGVFVIDFTYITRIDYSGMVELETIYDDLHTNNIDLHFVNVYKKSVRRCLKASPLYKKMGSEKFHHEIPMDVLRNLPNAKLSPLALEKNFEFAALEISDDVVFSEGSGIGIDLESSSGNEGISHVPNFDTPDSKGGLINLDQSDSDEDLDVKLALAQKDEKNQNNPNTTSTSSPSPSIMIPIEIPEITIPQNQQITTTISKIQTPPKPDSGSESDSSTNLSDVDLV